MSAQTTAQASAAPQSSDPPALLTVDGAVATITLNRPSAFNSINLEIAKTLERVAAQIEADDAVRVVVLEGAGRAFCAGGDVRTFGEHLNDVQPIVKELLTHYHAFVASLRRMPKIVISSVHGSAAGAGLSLAFMADICIAADDAKFTAAYNKLGVSPDGGGTAAVTEIAGTRRAMQIFLMEDSFSAQQAHDWGLVAKVVHAADLRQATLEIARKIARTAPDAIRTTKALIHSARSNPLERQLDAEAQGIADCMRSDAFKAAVRKFLEKT
jgi:enoyl-CoA hydratase/carnithine racemase